MADQTNSEADSCSVCNAKSVSRCGRCKTVSYCSESCQTNHWQLHKADCKRPNYLIKFHLCPDDIVDPPVWRTLSCPAIATFYTLHCALQIAFGWTHNHAYDFKVKDPQYREPEGDEGFLTEVRSLMNSGPISQEYQGDRSLPRKYLLRVSDKRSMEFGFTVDGPMGEARRRHPQTPLKEASKTKLFQIFDKLEFQGIERLLSQYGKKAYSILMQVSRLNTSMISGTVGATSLPSSVALRPRQTFLASTAKDMGLLRMQVVFKVGKN